MVVVTDKEYYMDNKLVEKLDLMVERMKRKMDNVLLIDGDEGYGKTNLEAGIAYYISYKTGRSFTVDNMFFDLNKLIDFASTTEEQIICWDEGALGGLAAEWWRKNQLEFIKLLMIARKKRHFFIICIPKFFKLNEYLVVDRSIALVHVYAKNEIKLGRFVYYNKKAKEKLFEGWRKKKMREYKKHYVLRGKFLEYLPKVIDEEEYERKKDEAILNFRKKDKNLTEGVYKIIKTKMEAGILQEFHKNYPEASVKDMAKWFGMGERTVYRRLKEDIQGFDPVS